MPTVGGENCGEIIAYVRTYQRNSVSTSQRCEAPHACDEASTVFSPNQKLADSPRALCSVACMLNVVQSVQYAGSRRHSS